MVLGARRWGWPRVQVRGGLGQELRPRGRCLRRLVALGERQGGGRGRGSPRGRGTCRLLERLLVVARLRVLALGGGAGGRGSGLPHGPQRSERRLEGVRAQARGHGHWRARLWLGGGVGSGRGRRGLPAVILAFLLAAL